MNIMVFTFEFTDNLKKIIDKLNKKDKKLADELYNKITEIIESEDIDHYKNLKYDLSDRKRVHIEKRFVLIFKFIKSEKHIIFLDFEHRDNVYKHR